jgi:phosphohistidine phosphatase SixA
MHARLAVPTGHRALARHEVISMQNDAPAGSCRAGSVAAKIPNQERYSMEKKRMPLAWRWISSCIITFMFILPGAGVSAAADEAGASATWDALRSGGHVVLMRHASAPGTGDPENFRLDDCSTQRNLSEQGRRQARASGELLRQHGVVDAEVYSSQWCRCLETARLLGFGPVQPLPALNSFFERDERGGPQTAQLRAFINNHASARTLILVTHQVNITALTDIYPKSGEAVVLRPHAGKLELVGRLPMPE